MTQRKSELATLLIVSFAACFAPLHAAEVRLPARSAMTSETGAGLTLPVAIADGGRYILLRSSAPNLVAGQVDGNGAEDLFLRDRSTGSVTLVTHAAGQPLQAAEHGSSAAAMTPDAEFVLFTSWAGDLVAGATRGLVSSDVYLWHRSTGATTLVSHLAGQPLAAAGRSRAVAITADGAFVLFDSHSPGLTPTPDSNGTSDVFLFRRATGSVALVSVAGGQAANRASSAAAVRADGNAVFFTSQASDLAAGSPNGGAYLRDLGAGTTSLIAAGGQARAMTPDGRYLLLGLGNDIHRRDRQTGTLEILADAAGSSLSPLISADGSRILYDSGGQARLWRQGSVPACLSCPAGGNALALSRDGKIAVFGGYSSDPYQIYFYDDATAAVELLSRDAAGLPAAEGGFYPAIAADGQFFAYAGTAPGLVGGGDRNGNFDAFFLQRGTPGVELLSGSAWPGPIVTTQGIGSNAIALSEDGEEVLFSGPAAIADLEADRATAAWAYRIAGGARRLLSPLPGRPATPASGWSQPLALARDGRALLLSGAPELVAGGAGFSAMQLYVYSPASQIYLLVTAQPGQPGQGTIGSIDQVHSDPALTKVLFAGNDAGLIPGGQPFAGSQLVACDAAGGGCALLSAASGAPQSGGNSGIVQLAAARDLGAAVFGSSASNLVAAGTPGGQMNTFLWRQGQGLALLSHPEGDPGSEANGETWPNGISADGRFVLVSSRATDLAPAILDGNDAQDVFVFDTLAGTWELISSTALFPGTTAAAYSRGLAISASGRQVLFFSAASDLVPGQVDSGAPFSYFEPPLDLFVFDRATGSKRLVSHRPGEPLAATGYAYLGCLSEDGSRVAFADSVESLDRSGFPGYPVRASVWDAADGEAVPILSSIGVTFLFPGTWPACQDYRFDGSRFLVNSYDGGLAPGDTNGWQDAVVVLLDSLFRDGFESGDTGAWSETTQ